MACPSYVAAKLISSSPNPNPTRPGIYTSPSFVSFRTRPGSAICSSSSSNDAVSVLQEKRADMTFYELLGIPDTGSLLEIKQAYKQLARKYHPDVSPPGRAGEYTQAFIMVQEAYETLSDPMRREMYDREIKMGLEFGFGSRNSQQRTGNKREWKEQWECQVSGLKTRSSYKEANGTMSWAARIRKQKDEASA